MFLEFRDALTVANDFQQVFIPDKIEPVTLDMIRRLKHNHKWWYDNGSLFSCTNGPLSSAVEQVWGSIVGSVKSAQCCQRLAINVSSEMCCPGTKPRR